MHINSKLIGISAVPFVNTFLEVVARDFLWNICARGEYYLSFLTVLAFTCLDIVQNYGTSIY